jgi:hypothetical protein
MPLPPLPLALPDLPMNAFRHLDVPYHSQWRSPELVAEILARRLDPCTDPRWTENGFADPEAYRFWSWKLCGLACLQSALDHWGIAHAPRGALLERALAHGVYRLREDGGVDGLIYRPFADWVAADFGLEVEVFGDHPLEALAQRLDAETLAIASVGPDIRQPDTPDPRRGGHLVLLHGRDAQGLWFHNPSGVPPQQSDIYLRHEVFERFYARRGMALRRAARAR